MDKVNDIGVGSQAQDAGARERASPIRSITLAAATAQPEVAHRPVRANGGGWQRVPLT